MPEGLAICLGSVLTQHQYTLMSVPSPAPKHIIRSHADPVSVVYSSDDNERIYSGDSSGTVVITSSRSLRAIATWKAHDHGLLGIQEWEDTIITSVRDAS